MGQSGGLEALNGRTLLSTRPPRLVLVHRVLQADPWGIAPPLWNMDTAASLKVLWVDRSPLLESGEFEFYIFRKVFKCTMKC